MVGKSFNMANICGSVEQLLPRTYYWNLKNKTVVIDSISNKFTAYEDYDYFFWIHDYGDRYWCLNLCRPEFFVLEFDIFVNAHYENESVDLSEKNLRMYEDSRKLGNINRNGLLGVTCTFSNIRVIKRRQNESVGRLEQQPQQTQAQQQPQQTQAQQQPRQTQAQQQPWQTQAQQLPRKIQLHELQSLIWPCFSSGLQFKEASQLHAHLSTQTKDIPNDETKDKPYDETKDIQCDDMYFASGDDRLGIHVKSAHGITKSTDIFENKSIKRQHVEGEIKRERKIRIAMRGKKCSKYEQGEGSRSLLDIEERNNAKINEPKTTRGLLALSGNLKDVFLDEEESDITLNVGDKKYPAHKIIIRARSPVFYAMLKNDTREKIQGFVDIPDCDPHIFRDFLLYLYTGKLDNISNENVYELYYMADKYEVKALKIDCIEFLSNNLSVDIICDVISLAARHSEHDLVNHTTAFFIENAKDILASVNWQKFVKENPEKANELFIETFNKVSEK